MASLAQGMINSDYDELDDVSVVPGGSSASWSDADISTIRRYSISEMSISQMVKYGEYVFECLQNGNDINTDLVISMMHLAVHLRDPDDLSKNLLQTPHTHRNSFINVTLPTVSEVNNAMDNAEREALLALRAAGNQNVEAVVEREDGNRNDNNNAMNDEDDNDENKGSNDVRAAAYAYLSAYLMRLQCRLEQNVSNGLKKAAERFRSWYDDTDIIAEHSNISLSSLAQLREALSRKPEITATWVLYLSVTENEKVLLKQPRGMLEYLGLQVFSYQGMHALTQVLAIHQISKVPLRELLKELDSPLTRQGLRAILEILKNHERTTKDPNRKTYFRYARVWDSKYFSQLQSKACVPLLYVAAVTVRDISPSSTSDPTQIRALQNIGGSLKEVLTEVARQIVEFVMERSLVDEKSGGAWEAAQAARAAARTNTQ
ncbi:TPA_asm: N [Medicago alphacytorhabdovirus 1]|nr:TPA_asm: N [Medicago alphacytorhabdovirus 1]